jgi:hypothetical protein
MAGSDRLSTVVRTLVKDDMISGGLTTYQSEKWGKSRKKSVNANKQHHLVHNQFHTATVFLQHLLQQHEQESMRGV